MFNEDDFKNTNALGKLAYNDAGIRKVKSVKEQYNENESLSEEQPITFADLATLPQFVIAGAAGSKELELFIIQYRKGRASGLDHAEAASDAWGAVTESSTQTPDGKYRINGTLDYSNRPENMKAAGLSPQAAGVLSAFKKAQGVFRK